jgi:hypothetical protein
MNYGGSGVEKSVIDWIIARTQSPDTVIELGAGDVSTPAISAHCGLISIENDYMWCDRWPKVRYINAPIHGEWYDPVFLERHAEALTQAKGTLVDGPYCEKRIGMLARLYLFNLDGFFIFHDSKRDDVIGLSVAIAQHVRRPVKFLPDFCCIEAA